MNESHSVSDGGQRSSAWCALYDRERAYGTVWQAMVGERINSIGRLRQGGATEHPQEAGLDGVCVFGAGVRLRYRLQEEARHPLGAHAISQRCKHGLYFTASHCFPHPLTPFVSSRRSCPHAVLTAVCRLPTLWLPASQNNSCGAAAASWVGNQAAPAHRSMSSMEKEVAAAC